MSGQVERLRNDWCSIREAATTVCLAFSNDPLIRWIRPGARPWSELDPRSVKFQHRRVQRMNEEHLVFGLMNEEHPRQEFQKSPNVSVKEALNSGEEVKYAAIAMVEAPQQTGFSFRRAYLALKYWLLEKLNPCMDPGGVFERFELMMQAHDSGLKEMRRQLHPRKPWYIEVIAVRPSSHGKGLGGKMLRGIIDTAGDAPIVLECTDKATIGFYRKYGFEVVKDMVLKDPAKPEHDTICYWMVRQ